MNPILLFPKKAEQVKLFLELAKEQGVDAERISKKWLDEFDDFLFGRELYERRKSAKIISHDELKATFKRLIEEK